MPKYFKWRLDDCIPRKGPALKRDTVYAVADFPAAVVDEWAKTGAAQITEDKVAPKKEVPVKVNGGN